MGEVADILKATHDFFDGGNLSVSVDERGLGMAYAVPRGLESTAVDTYGPWHDAEMRQVFYRDSAIVQSVLAEIQLIMTWRYSEAQQYIIEAYLTNNVISMDPTVNVKMQVHFDNPHLYDTNLEAYEIPFRVEAKFEPLVGGKNTTNYRGVIRADGSGSFDIV
jgi:hypothetical protein